jgi:diguanylate cyclase (GGDEF)-like protein/PAS domain S-box-containing protein
MYVTDVHLVSARERPRLSLRRALAGSAGLTALVDLSLAASGAVQGYPGFQLGIIAINGVLLSALLSSGCARWLRTHARKAGSANAALHQACSISSDAVCICSVKDGTLLKINDGFTALTGYGEPEVLDQKVSDLALWQYPLQYQALVKTLQRVGKMHQVEVSLISKTGTVKVGVLTASLIEFQAQVCIIASIRDASELKRAQESIEKLSYYDSDTGLPNQNLLMDRLNQLISLNSRDHRPTAVVYVGMDGFKGIVDALGHSGSNEVVRDLARRLTETLRHSDTVARLNRDELVIVLGGDLRDADFDIVIAKIERVFALPIQISGGEVIIKASLGIACFMSDGLTGEILLQHSHAAMNQARENSDSFQYYSASMNVKAMERLSFESCMMKSLEAGEFFLCYQPKYASNGCELTGMEALVRWSRDGEIVQPDKFIPVAEENGMIVRLGEWVLQEACRQNQSWQLEGLAPLQVSVNISARQLRDSDFVDKVERTLRETGLAPAFLELEITETAIMGISDDIILKLLRLKELGVSISIDDFGTGYSSLSYLKNLPVDKIKIDRSFVMDIVSDPGDAAIVEAIISIAHALGLCVIAEGVENKDQLDFLIGRACTEFQGHYFSKPLGARDFAELLKQKRAGLGHPAGCREEKKGPLQLPDYPASRERSLLLAEAKGEGATSSGQMMTVARKIKPVSPQDRIINILSRFQRDKDLNVLPVVEGVAIVGLVNRSTFLEDHIIGRNGFAAHINHAKKIRELMEPVEFTFDAATPIEEAARTLQPVISTLRIDNICITRNGAYAGVIDVNRFIKAMTDIQIVLAKGANPLTGLPGNTCIERDICGRLDSGIPFDIAYLDIDNFKPFNDHYGFQKGDAVIKRLAEILTGMVAESSLAATSFCGHIGGDDFILITESLQAERLSRQIIATFEGERLGFHGEADHANGGYRAANRKGDLESFPLLSLSVGIVNSSLSRVGSYAKLASLSTEVKKGAKKKTGSSIVVDGRALPGTPKASRLTSAAV